MVSLSTLSQLSKDPTAVRYPIRCRLITRFQDLEMGDTNGEEGSLGDKVRFCTVSLRDIALFQREQEKKEKRGVSLKDDDGGVYFYMNETVYGKLFVDEISCISNGDPVEVDVALWVGETDWEVLDMRKLSLKEVDDLATFLRSEAGERFLELMEGDQRGIAATT